MTLAIQKESTTFASTDMKYSELHRKLRKAGCYPTGLSMAKHPQWYSPHTGRMFYTSHHDKEEVAVGTLKKILREAGL